MYESCMCRRTNNVDFCVSDFEKLVLLLCPVLLPDFFSHLVGLYVFGSLRETCVCVCALFVFSALLRAILGSFRLGQLGVTVGVRIQAVVIQVLPAGS